ncbi:MAG TPA: hypothetical protein VHM90_09540, partial [Phycisphaerae bacterium]|nr:hypothetical protein [Phycisphaerae bacterium]
MAEIDLQAKFPNLRPVKKAPTMHMINGIGTRVYGERDRDAETGAYLTTLCFCVLMVPIVAIRAYRVVRSPRGGWYFLGTEPLSLLAKTWNLSLVATVFVVCGYFGIQAYTSRPEYIAHKKMTQAADYAREGDLTQASHLYTQLILNNTHEAANAGEALKRVIDDRCGSSGGNQAAGVFTDAARLTANPHAYSSKDLITRGMQAADSLSGANPRGALALLAVLRELTLDPRDIDKVRLPLLQKWVASEPGNMEAAVDLASLLVEQDQFDDARKLLLPFKDKLGTGEGARVMGMICVHDNKYDEAYALLWPYVQPRLDSLHAAENREESAIKAAWDHEVQLLRENKGPPDFYKAYEAASKDEQDALVSNYISGRLKDNPEIRAVQDAAERETHVVPVVLDLGMVMLERAQGIADPAQRKQQLEATQSIFLAIKGSAGETDQYRLFLGQVYYWLNKQAEGKALFDQFLAAKGRSPRSLLEIGGTLRAVGDDTSARAAAEEAYAKATESNEKFAAAHLRSLIQKDLDDEIEWLRKCDQNQPEIKVTLANSMGYKALEEGREAEAATQFRSALEICNTMPRNEYTFNQISLASYSLYRATGDPADLAHSVDAIQQAVNILQSDSVLLGNAGTTILESSFLDVFGKDIDFHLLRLPASASAAQFLYHDEASQAALIRKIAAHPGIGKATADFDKVMVLAPKSLRGYEPAFEVQFVLHNDAGIRSIEQRMKAADVDAADNIRDTLDFLAGKDDAKHAVTRNTMLKRLESVTPQARARGGPTLAMALTSQAELLMQMDVTDSGIDAEKVMQLAADAHAA